ncbi:MAG: hypothetical protein C5B50_03555 [Verrucomicrobia bacterium]|nr:MAG: hypothetical protein C5B50_03555 [Verrucomicrobiota bacterium]
MFDFGFRISDFGLRILGFEYWTLDFRLWSLDFGLWTLDFGLWTLDFGLWTLDPRRLLRLPRTTRQTLSARKRQLPTFLRELIQSGRVHMPFLRTVQRLVLLPIGPHCPKRPAHRLADRLEDPGHRIIQVLCIRQDLRCGVLHGQPALCPPSLQIGQIQQPRVPPNQPGKNNCARNRKDGNPKFASKIIGLLACKQQRPQQTWHQHCHRQQPSRNRAARSMARDYFHEP